MKLSIPLGKQFFDFVLATPFFTILKQALDTVRISSYTVMDRAVNNERMKI